MVDKALEDVVQPVLDVHSYDIDPILMMLTPSKRAGLSKSSLCLLANRQQRSCKDITFSFSSTLLGERFYGRS